MKTHSSLVFACYDRSCAPPPAGKGGSSPKGSSGVSDRARKALAQGDTIPLSSIGIGQAPPRLEKLIEETRGDDSLWDVPAKDINPSKIRFGAEESVKTRHVAKVVEGREPLREGYNPRLYDLGDGTFAIADGHTRAVMHNLMGSKSFKAHVLPLPENFKPLKEDAIIRQWRESRMRTEPGRGAALNDDGIPGDKSIRIRSIPNVPTERLKRRADYLKAQTGTPEAIRSFDEPRRSLIHNGVNLLAINHELKLRRGQ